MATNGSDRTIPRLPIDFADASASMSLADTNLIEDGFKRSTKEDFQLENNDLNGVSTSLPHQEEIRGQPKKRSRLLCLLIPLSLVVIAIALGIGISFALNTRSHEESSKSISQKNQDSPRIPVTPSALDDDSLDDDILEFYVLDEDEEVSDKNDEILDEDEDEEVLDEDEEVWEDDRIPKSTVEEENAFDELVTYLVNENVSSSNDLYSVGSPQNLAAQWLTIDDDANLPLPTDSISDSQEAYLYMFRYVMAVNYFAFRGDNWVSRMNFLSESSVCTWNRISLGLDGPDVVYEQGGVRCDVDTGLPITLDMEFNNLVGEIPTEIGLLTSLKFLDLEHNHIVGTIPSELCNLSDLNYLYLQNNYLKGQLPSCISNLEKLAYLRINTNSFSRTLPSSPGLCALTQLRVLTMDRNMFSGTLPSCISQFTKLKWLSTSDNSFSGTLPDLSSMQDLELLYLDGNFFRGNPSTSISNLSKLRFLYLEENEFMGDIDNIANGAVDLIALDLSSNGFRTADGIPGHFFELQKLKVLDLSNNYLRGTVPDDISPQQNLIFFSVHRNMMIGSIPSMLQNLDGLLHLDLSNNDFDGLIPDELFEMSGLQNLFLSENPRLTAGPFPEGLKSMKQLQEISLKNTNRSGPLPDLLGFDDLVLLDLDQNLFDGTVPENYGTLTNLRYLLLNRNPSLGGRLPQFTQTNNLVTILLDGTGISGNFSSICNLPAFTLQSELDSDVVALADCSDADSGIYCPCCVCCSKERSGSKDKGDWCSRSVVDSLDWTWENGFRRTSRDFGIDAELLNTSKVPPS